MPVSLLSNSSGYIKFGFNLGETAAYIHKKLNIAFEDQSMMCTKTFECFPWLKENRIVVDVEPELERSIVQHRTISRKFANQLIKTIGEQMTVKPVTESWQ